jgi:hypothetical protein
VDRPILTDVLRALDTEWASRPEHAVAWPDPHPERDPDTDEYSRVTDPERYRVVGARAEAWIAVLVRLGLAEAGPVPVPDGGAAVQLLPFAPDAQPVLVTTRELEGVPGAVVDLAVGDPPVSGAMQPDCGCDACDSGSADLLDAVDDAFVRLLGGRLAVVVGKDWQIIATADGWSASSSPYDTEDAIARARRGEQLGERTFLGSSWWTV